MDNGESKCFAQDVAAVSRTFEVDPSQGLTAKEAAARRDEFGLNRLRQAKKVSPWKVLLEQFKSIVILLMGAAAILAFATARWPEGIALVAVLVVNTAIGFFSEWQAVRSMEALRERERVKVKARRGGREQEIFSDQLVPGDVVLLSAGQMIPTDVRLISVERMRVSEAALTGESVPVVKGPEPVEEDAQLAERTCMAYKGTEISDGSGEGIVCATGMQTELGTIARLADEAEDQATPLQERLNGLGRRLAWITLLIAAVVAGVGLAVGRDAVLMIETAIALGVAAIPEGLPIVATIALARGMWLMAKRNALINRLPAVETLGATRIIFTDKTGTLTENRMRLHTVTVGLEDIELAEDASEGGADNELVAEALETGVLCNDAALAEGEEAERGDPMEVALLLAAKERGIEPKRLVEEKPREREEHFSRETMMMATFHRQDGQLRVAVKGAPRRVLESCTRVLTAEGDAALDDAQRAQWVERLEALAAKGLRVLAVAEKDVQDAQAEPYEDLKLIGLLGLQDPPRMAAREAILDCQKAGMRPIMITGDEPTTARAIGQQVGLELPEGAEVVHGRDVSELDKLSEEDKQRLRRTNIFARVTPQQKLDLIALYQEAGEIVAMTGDGINDAPALKKADIGIAMGQRGTEAAKQVSDMILQDDQFSTIVAAVRQGRVIFANIRKSVVFMLCTNLAEIAAVAIASFVGIPLPLRPLQILYLNVLTDVFPALALGVGKGDANVMEYPPRASSEAVLTKHHWTAIGLWSTVLAICVLGALGVAMQWLGLNETQAVTVSFLTLAFGKLWFVLNLRDRKATVFNNDIVRNVWIWASIALCTCLLLLSVFWDFLSRHLETENPGGAGWIAIFAISAIPALLGIFVPGIRFYTTAPEQKGK